MLNNFIYAQTKDLFLEALGAGNILDEAIVFIEDTKEIWNHGTYFDCSTLDPNLIPNIQTEIDELKTTVDNKADKATTLSGYGITDGVKQEIIGNLVTADVQALYGGGLIYALPDSASGDEDEVLLSQGSVKTINGESIYGSGDISVSRYAECNSEAASTLKVITLDNFSYKDGNKVVVKFVNGVTAISALSVNSSTTGVLYRRTLISVINLPANSIVEFTYGNNVWNITGGYQASGNYYGTCSTAAGTVAKTVNVDSSFVLKNGAEVTITFTYGNTVTNPTLNVNSTGAKSLLTNDYVSSEFMTDTIITVVYNGAEWVMKGSSNAITVGGVNGYTLQTINSSTCGLGISMNASVSSSSDGDLFIHHGGSNSNAIYCNGGNIVANGGHFVGAYVHNTRIITSTATLNANDSLVLYNTTGSYTVTLPSNPIDGQVITVIKPNSTGTLTFSCATAILNAPKDNISNSSAVSINSIGVRTLYYINSKWYIFLTSNA